MAKKDYTYCINCNEILPDPNDTYCRECQIEILNENGLRETDEDQD